MPPHPTKASKDARALWIQIKDRARIVGGFVGLFWAIHIVNAILFGGRLAALGVRPRSLSGLIGVLFAPFLHGSFAHVSANTVPFLVLGALVMSRRKRDFWFVSLVSAIIGGLGTWLIAPSASVHIGASGLVFGFLGFLLSRGVFERKFWSILGSIAVFFLYGGILWGVLPGQLGISWQGHLFGLVGGVIAAWLMHGKSETRSKVLSKIRIAAPRARIDDSPSAEDEELEEELERLKKKRMMRR